MSARGFTLVELAVVMTISAIIIPCAYVIQRSFETNQGRSLARVEAARTARGVSEELRKDLRTRHFDGAMRLSTGEGAAVLADPCATVAYVVSDAGALTRQIDAACGPSRVVARNVAGITRDGNVVTLKLAHRMRDGSTATDAFVFGFADGGAP